MNLTTVFNLTTGEELGYTLPAREAVRAAWFQEHGKNNTWEYDEPDAPVTEGNATIGCGDWCAIKEDAHPRSIVKGAAA